MESPAKPNCTAVPLAATIAGRLAVKPWEALWLAGLAGSPAQAAKTARNRICDGRFPLPLRRVGGRPVVLVADLLAALGIEPPPVERALPSRRPGRPRKGGT